MEYIIILIPLEFSYCILQVLINLIPYDVRKKELLQVLDHAIYMHHDS